MTILDVAETIRNQTLHSMKADAGQYFTPARLAEQVVARIQLPSTGILKVLDLGAGAGALTAALIERVEQEAPSIIVRVVCVEQDNDLIPHLHMTLANHTSLSQIVHGDALQLAAFDGLDTDFDVVVMNPPYGKLAAQSEGRTAMAHLGVETPNLYAAFMAVGYLHLRDGGQMAAIVPRSWANGPYFKRFRHHMLDHVAVDHIQTFASRSTLFSEAKVLQENVIITVSRGGEQGDVSLTFDNDETRRVPWSEIVLPADPERFVRIPTGSERMPSGVPLTALGLTASTGKVVDFRARDRLAPASDGIYPLIYPGNIFAGALQWPREIGKAQAFNCEPDETRRYLTEAGAHVVVKRFSSKEERRRVVAAAYITDAPVAYENKLNVIACPDRDVAVGLALWLNSTAVDQHFRSFSGHTQVNATDLRTMPYPSLKLLRDLGGKHETAMPDQGCIDEAIEALL